MANSSSNDNERCRPFLKWAGGKTQLIPEILNWLPPGFEHAHTYVEPFAGSGALLFNILRQFPHIKKAIINDFNEDLVNTYNTIKHSVNELISELFKLEKEFRQLNSHELQRGFFMNIRSAFNSRQSNLVRQSAYLIFLNKTCFNGLYRVNSNNYFNVPFGRYKNPLICDSGNLLKVSNALQRVEILNGDYSNTLSFANDGCFFYLDPPYKPISATASFNSYGSTGFNDEQQVRLKKFCDNLDTKGAKWLLSNSDLKNIDPENSFFDELYSGYHIRRVKAKRSINSVGKSRGEINELLISNY